MKNPTKSCNEKLRRFYRFLPEESNKLDCQAGVIVTLTHWGTTRHVLLKYNARGMPCWCQYLLVMWFIDTKSRCQ